jgi:hypothetical protein
MKPATVNQSVESFTSHRARWHTSEPSTGVKLVNWSRGRSVYRLSKCTRGKYEQPYENYAPAEKPSQAVSDETEASIAVNDSFDCKILIRPDAYYRMQGC